MNTAIVDDQAVLAATLLAPELPCPPGLRAWNGSDPARRLAVHRNNVVGSLIDALADAFPVTQAMVGSEFFRAMAAVFVRRHPPRSRVLAHYGSDLPAFIERFEPARPLPYLPDLARLEHARLRACHAADVEAVGADAIRAALSCGDGLHELRLRLHPSTSVQVSAFAVVSLWAAHQTDDDREISAVDPGKAESALIVRDGLEVVVLLLAPGFATFIFALGDGEGLAEAAALASTEAVDFDLGVALSLLMRHGAITSLHIPERGNP